MRRRHHLKILELVPNDAHGPLLPLRMQMRIDLVDEHKRWCMRRSVGIGMNLVEPLQQRAGPPENRAHPLADVVDRHLAVVCNYERLPGSAVDPAVANG